MVKNKVISLKKTISNPTRLVAFGLPASILNRLPDELYLKIKFKATFGYHLDLDNPITFSEKMQWIKLYHRLDLQTTLVDKFLVKEYVKNVIGEAHIIPTLGVWDCFDDIDFNQLPNQFVLKCTHDSGGLVICKDKGKLDYQHAKDKINKSLKKNYYYVGREWPYKNVQPRIIAETYLDVFGNSKDGLLDYKFFCFNGKVRCFKIDFDRFTHHRANYYDLDMNLLDLGEDRYPPDKNRTFEKPHNFDDMIQIAEELSKGSLFMRVDLYNINGHIYFGEITYFPASGFGEFLSYENDRMLGEWLELP